MAESPVTVHTHTHNTYTKWVRCTKYLYSSWNSLTRLSNIYSNVCHKEKRSINKIEEKRSYIIEENNRHY